jgi:hypothetical protein
MDSLIGGEIQNIDSYELTNSYNTIYEHIYNFFKIHKLFELDKNLDLLDKKREEIIKNTKKFNTALIHLKLDDKKININDYNIFKDIPDNICLTKLSYRDIYQ